MECFVVVPAYNEAKNIASVIAGLQKNGFGDIVVVDDGSSDGTAERAGEAGKAREAGAAKVIVLRHPVNRGQGAALETGDKYALSHGAEWIVHFDADAQHDPTDIAPALEKIKTNKLDAVLGSRFLKPNTLPASKRFILLPLARLIGFIFTGVWLSDAHNGFRILSRRALEKIKITERGMAHASEIVAKLRANGMRFKEVPVTVRYHRYGQGLGGGGRVVIDLLKQFFL